MKAYVVPLSKAAQEFGPKPDVYVYWRPAQKKNRTLLVYFTIVFFKKRGRNQNKVVEII